jgi:hypothetical protein
MGHSFPAEDFVAYKACPGMKRKSFNPAHMERMTSDLLEEPHLITFRYEKDVKLLSTGNICDRSK